MGNLPASFNPKKVKAVFKEYGTVESVRIRSVAVQGMAVDKAGDQVRSAANRVHQGGIGKVLFSRVLMRLVVRGVPQFRIARFLRLTVLLHYR